MEELAKQINSHVFDFMVFDDTSSRIINILLGTMEATAKKHNIGALINSGALTEEEHAIADALANIVMLTEQAKAGNVLLAKCLFECLKLDNLCIAYLIKKGYTYYCASK